MAQWSPLLTLPGGTCYEQLLLLPGSSGNRILEIRNIIYKQYIEDTHNTKLVHPQIEDCSCRGNEDELIRYERYLRQELPPAVRVALEIQIEQAFSLLEEQPRGQLVVIVRDTQLQLFQSYVELRRSRMQQVLAVTTSEARMHAEQRLQKADINIDDPTGMLGLDEQTMEHMLNHLAPYDAPPLMDNPLDYNLDTILFDMQECGERDSFKLFCDSAYENGFSYSTAAEKQTDSWLKAGDNSDTTIFDNGEGSSGAHS